MTRMKRAAAYFLAVVMTLIPLATCVFAGENRSIVIEYVFEDGKQAAPPYTATVSKYSSFKDTVYSPSVIGYSPDKNKVEIDIDSVEDDETIYVTYSPAIVGFIVNHYLQNVNDDNYTLKETENKTGYTEDSVGTALENTYDGFTALYYDSSVEIAADGSTEIDIYYDRNYYLLSLDLNGGYGSEPVYARYGADISVTAPIKPGYVFGGWEPTIPQTMPSQNEKHAAIWTEGTASYLVQYWLENANDDNYSYKESVTKTGNVGTSVSGSNDKSYDGFTFYSADTNAEVKGDGSTVVNVYYKRNKYTIKFYSNSGTEYTDYRIEAKYEANISSQWPSHNGSSMWETEASHKNFTGNNVYQANIDTMPLGGAKFYYKNSGNTKYSASYYLEALPNGTGTNVGGTTYYLDHTDTVKASNTLNVTEEDSYDIEGFDFNSNISTAIGEKYNGSKFYYTRHKYTLTFRSANADVKTSNVPFGYTLSYSVDKDYVPPYPSNYEADLYEFGGWYLDVGCTDPVDFDNMTMPSNSLVVYAKWTPKTHTVRTFLTIGELNGEPIDTWENVEHMSTVDAPDDPIRSGTSYIFVGWFYSEDGVEKAFDFSMAITKDLDLYAKWSAKAPVIYTLYYVLDSTGEEIATPYTGSALAGTTKTFEAKFGDNLYEEYRTGYFPKTASHSITMDVEGDNTFTFRYVPREKVPYTVKYLEAGTERVLHTEKNTETSENVITEYFEPIEGYVPDQPQKRLVLSAEDENLIIFYYTADTEHAYITINHYKQNISGNGYTLEEYSSFRGTIGQEYTTEQKNYNGFEFNSSISSYNGTLTTSGLVFNLYYDRVEYPYEFKFVDSLSREEIAESVTGEARYGASVYCNAKSINGYKLISENTLTIKTDIEETTTPVKNVAVFYYKPYFNIVHVKHDGNEVISVSDPVETELEYNFDITAKVSDGYLYGGTFDSSECEAEDIHNFGEENATDFTPTAGETYYIWEVNEKYLFPKLYVVSQHSTDEKHKGELYVYKVFLMTTIDRTEYREVGFIRNGISIPSGSDEQGSVGVSGMNSVVYGYINVYNSTSDGLVFREQLYSDNGDFAVDKTETNEGDNGYLAQLKMTASEFVTSPFTFVPYFITLDGIEVTGTTEKTCTHKGYGSKYLDVDEEEIGSQVSPVASITESSLMFVEYAALDYDDIELEEETNTPSEETNNIENVENIEDIADEEDITLDGESETTDDTITITVYDTDVYELTLDGGDISDELQYIGKDGCYFAGWYTDDGYANAADLTTVYEDITVYAKYISDDYLSAECVAPYIFGKYYIVTAIDSDCYAETGFIVDGVEYTVDVYLSNLGFYSPRFIFGRGISNDSKLYALEFPDTEEESITVTPYYKTYDGTTIYGEEKSFTNEPYYKGDRKWMN